MIVGSIVGRSEGEGDGAGDSVGVSVMTSSSRGCTMTTCGEPSSSRTRSTSYAGLANKSGNVKEVIDLIRMKGSRRRIVVG